MTFKHPANRYLGKDQYELLEDYAFEWMQGRIKWRITVPKGFICDLASIPRPVWSALGLTPGADMTGPGTLHDFLYTHGGHLPKGCVQYLKGGIWWEETSPGTRGQADWLFLEAMRQSGIPWHRRQAAWAAVRAFGGSRWRS